MERVVRKMFIPELGRASCSGDAKRERLRGLSGSWYKSLSSVLKQLFK